MKHLGDASRIWQLLLDGQDLYSGSRNWLLAGAIAIAAVLAVTTLKACDDYDDVALELSNEKASHDVTRVSDLSAKNRSKILGDSIQSLERLIVQVAPKKDALDNATGRKSVVRGDITLPGLTMTKSASAPVQMDSLTVRSADFHIRDKPFTVDAHVELPPAPGIARLEMSVALDTARIGVRIQRGKLENGVAQCTALVTPPAWQPVVIGKLEADPGVCGNDKKHGRMWKIGIGIGPGVTRSNGEFHFGWTAMGGVLVGF